MKNKPLILTWIAVLALSFHGAIGAETFKRFSVGGFAAYYSTSSSNFIDADTSFDTSAVFGGALTYHFTPRYSLELWATRYGTDMNLSFDGKEATLGELNQTPILLTGRFQFPIRKSPANIYLGLGIGYSFNEFDQVKRTGLDDFFAVNLETKKIDDCLLYALNAGAELKIKKQYALFTDAKIIFSEPGFDVAFEDGSTAKKKVGMNESVLSLGFKYFF